MKKQFKNIGFFLLVLMMGMTIFSSCENDIWNQHYGSNSKTVSSNQTLWQNIKANPDLSKFAWALRVTGYDVILSTSQMFTIWAPSNAGALHIDTLTTNLDTIAKYKKQFVENHISRYSYSVTGNFDKRIVLINKKITHFKSVTGGAVIGDVSLAENNIISKNGILHVLGTSMKFFPNIWEYLAANSELDSIRKYLYSFDVITFDPSKSIPGDVNAEGNIVYLDSVKYNNNIMFSMLGRLNNEDSTYQAILPTNTAWNKSYANIKNYYKYYYNPLQPNTAPLKITADTLQRKYTCLSLVRDLVFSKTWQKAPNDSLTSTSMNVFKQPAYLFDGLTSKTASNGTYYLSDDLKYRDYESWNKEIRVEAEYSGTRTPDAYSSLFERYYTGKDTIAVSKSRYIEILPLFTSSAPSVTFDIPNTLSGKLRADKTIEYGASYNVYCVFLPGIIKGLTKPAKAWFTLSYMDPTSVSPRPTNGIVSFTYNNLGPDGKTPLFFEVNPYYVTKQLIASKVTFPYCEAGFKTPNVKIKVISGAKSSESVKYTRDLLIDCIILEPVH